MAWSRDSIIYQAMLSEKDSTCEERCATLKRPEPNAIKQVSDEPVVSTSTELVVPRCDGDDGCTGCQHRRREVVRDS